MRNFGCLCYAHLSKKPQDKSAPRVKPSIFVGYPGGQKGYNIYDLEDKRIYVSEQFFKDIYPFECSQEAKMMSRIDLGQSVIFDELSRQETNCVENCHTIEDCTATDNLEATSTCTSPLQATSRCPHASSSRDSSVINPTNTSDGINSTSLAPGKSSQQVS